MPSNSYQTGYILLSFSANNSSSVDVDDDNKKQQHFAYVSKIMQRKQNGLFDIYCPEHQEPCIIVNDNYVCHLHKGNTTSNARVHTTQSGITAVFKEPQAPTTKKRGGKAVPGKSDEKTACNFRMKTTVAKQLYQKGMDSSPVISVLYMPIILCLGCGKHCHQTYTMGKDNNVFMACTTYQCKLAEGAPKANMALTGLYPWYRAFNNQLQQGQLSSNAYKILMSNFHHRGTGFIVELCNAQKKDDSSLEAVLKNVSEKIKEIYNLTTSTSQQSQETKTLGVGAVIPSMVQQQSVISINTFCDDEDVVVAAKPQKRKRNTGGGEGDEGNNGEKTKRVRKQQSNNKKQQQKSLDLWVDNGPTLIEKNNASKSGGGGGDGGGGVFTQELEMFDEEIDDGKSEEESTDGGCHDA